MSAASTLFALIPSWLLVFAGPCCADTPVTYNFEVKPILAEHCFKCHGQDEKQRKAKLRFDDRANALAAKAIIPGDPEGSELVRRSFPAILKGANS
jgi:hypothetical protein